MAIMRDRADIQAPGMAYHCNEPGWFRVTFTIARDDLLVCLLSGS
jgi:hypothetical protein